MDGERTGCIKATLPSLCRETMIEEKAYTLSCASRGDFVQVTVQECVQFLGGKTYLEKQANKKQKSSYNFKYPLFTSALLTGVNRIGCYRTGATFHASKYFTLGLTLVGFGEVQTITPVAVPLYMFTLKVDNAFDQLYTGQVPKDEGAVHRNFDVDIVESPRTLYPGTAYFTVTPTHCIYTHTTEAVLYSGPPKPPDEEDNFDDLMVIRDRRETSTQTDPDACEVENDYLKSILNNIHCISGYPQTMQFDVK